MAFISDTLLVAGTFCLVMYCFVLSRRLNKFSNLESDIGKVITNLSKQIDTLAKSIQSANENSKDSVRILSSETEKAQAAARHLELLVASLHTLPEKRKPNEGNPFFARKKAVSAVAK